MPITPITSGTTIVNADITSMHDSVRTLLNAMDQDKVQRSGFGPQHLEQGIVIDADFVCVDAEQLVEWSAGDIITAETTTDIKTGNWKTIAPYQLNNGGPGYVLPPCKVLVWFDCRVQRIDYDPVAFTPNSNMQLWLALYYSVNGVEVVEMIDTGMIHNHPDFGSGHTPKVEEPTCITLLIDLTAIGANWTLDYVRVKAALGSGSGFVAPAGHAALRQGYLGFIAFYRDD